MEQQDRYCRNCGQQLLQEDKFCAGCGRSVFDAAHVPTPEADVPVPLPPQSATGSVSPPQPLQPRRSGFWDQFKWPILVLVGSVIVASLVSAAADPAISAAGPAGSAESLGTFTGVAIGSGLILLIYSVPLWLVSGVVIFFFARLLGKKPRFTQVIYSWWMVVPMVLVVLWNAWDM